MLTRPSMTVGAGGSAWCIPVPICWLLRVQQMVGAQRGHKYPGEG